MEEERDDLSEQLRMARRSHPPPSDEMLAYSMTEQATAQSELLHLRRSLEEALGEINNLKKMLIQQDGHLGAAEAQRVLLTDGDSRYAKRGVELSTTISAQAIEASDLRDRDAGASARIPRSQDTCGHGTSGRPCLH